MNSNVRIKELRQTLGLSQEEFGSKISCSRDTINNYERLRANVPPPTELAIASVYGVDIDWLRTGKGVPFAETKEQYVDNLVKRFGLDDFAKRIILAYSELNQAEQTVIKRFISKLNDPDQQRLTATGKGGSEDIKLSDPKGAKDAFGEILQKHNVE